MTISDEFIYFYKANLNLSKTAFFIFDGHSSSLSENCQKIAAEIEEVLQIKRTCRHGEVLHV